MVEKFTIQQFHSRYPDDNTCLEEIFRQRYDALTICPQCHKEAKFYRIRGRKRYDCAFCGYQLHPLADTIFHKSSTSLKSWFFAIYLFANSKNGVSAKELERHLGVTYKTAWRMAKQIRTLFQQDDNQLKNTVEVDETYMGGKGRGTRGRGAKNKKPVIGVVERGGKVKATVTDNVKRSTVFPLINQSVEKGAQVMTDEYHVYTTVSLQGYKHSSIKHSAKQYVLGDVHTNTIEGFWSQLKRSISGTYHAVSPKYLQYYVDEFAYRYNHRNSFEHLFSLLIPTAAKLV